MLRVRNTIAPATTSLDLQGFGLSLNRVFYREGRVNPFLSLGVGHAKTDLKPGDDDDRSRPRCTASAC